MAIQADTVQYGPWTDGVLYSNAVEDVGPKGLSDMWNMRIGSSGQVETRAGTASYQSASALAGTPTVTLCTEFKPNASTTYVVIAAGSALYYYNSGWSAITGSLTITAGDTNTFESANCNGTLVATNGVDAPWKWTGAGNATALDVDSRFTTAEHMAWYDNRLWMANTNANTSQLWYSDIGDIETWGATSFYNFQAEITALVPAQNALIVHTRDGISTLIPTGNTTIPYHRQQRTVEAGVNGLSTVSLPADVQLFLQDDGIYSWSGGAQVTKISYQLDDGYWPEINTSALSNAFAIRYPDANEVWFFLPYGTGQTKPNHIVAYNTRYNCWSGPWEYTAGRACTGLVSGKPHAGGFDGILYDMEAGTNDNGSAISWSFTTGSPAPFGSDVRLRWLYARTYFDGAGDYYASVTQDSSGLIGTTEQLSLKSDSFVLGADALGAGILGTTRMIGRDTDLSGYDPHSSLKYSNGGINQVGTFRRIHLQYKPIGRKRRRARNS